MSTSNSENQLGFTHIGSSGSHTDQYGIGKLDISARRNKESEVWWLGIAEIHFKNPTEEQEMDAQTSPTYSKGGDAYSNYGRRMSLKQAEFIKDKICTFLMEELNGVIPSDAEIDELDKLKNKPVIEKVKNEILPRIIFNSEEMKVNREIITEYILPINSDEDDSVIHHHLYVKSNFVSPIGKDLISLLEKSINDNCPDSDTLEKIISTIKLIEEQQEFPQIHSDGLTGTNRVIEYPGHDKKNYIVSLLTFDKDGKL